MDTTTPTPAVEAVIRTPFGEVRVWVDPEGAVRTAINAEMGGAPLGEAARANVIAVIEQASRAVRATLGCEASTLGSPAAFGEWMDARVERDPNNRISSLTLYEDYLGFCRRSAARPLSMRGFGDALGERQILLAGKDQFGRKLRGGLRLRPAEDTPALRVVS